MGKSARIKTGQSVNKRIPASVFTVWQIMRAVVNDNVPPYGYWFKRILVSSVVILTLDVLCYMLHV